MLYTYSGLFVIYFCYGHLKDVVVSRLMISGLFITGFMVQAMKSLWVSLNNDTRINQTDLAMQFFMPMIGHLSVGIQKIFSSAINFQSNQLIIWTRLIWRHFGMQLICTRKRRPISTKSFTSEKWKHRALSVKIRCVIKHSTFRSCSSRGCAAPLMNAVTTAHCRPVAKGGARGLGHPQHGKIPKF